MLEPFFTRLYTRFGEFGGGNPYPNPSYTGIRGRRMAVSGESQLQYKHPWSASGQFQSLYIRIDNSGDGHGGAIPALGFSVPVTYTVVIGGVDTSLVVTLQPGQTSGSDTTHTAAVAPGQTFWIRIDAVGGANPFAEFNQFDTHLGIVFQGSGIGVSGHAVNSNGGTIGPSGSPFFSSPFGSTSSPFGLSAGPNPQDPDLYNYVAAAGSLTRFDVIVDTAPGGGGDSWNFAVIKNGVLQDGSGGTVDTRFSIVGGATTGFGTFSLHCAVGDWISFRALKGGAAATTFCSYSCAFTADIDGQFNFCASSAGAPPSTTVASHMGSSYWSGWDVNGYPDVLLESDIMVDVGLQAFQIAGLIVWVSGSHGGPPAQYSYFGRGNQANIGSPVILTNQTVGQVNFSPVPFAAHNTFSFLALPANAPAGRGLAWTFLLQPFIPPPPPPPTRETLLCDIRGAAADKGFRWFLDRYTPGVEMRLWEPGVSVHDQLLGETDGSISILGGTNGDRGSDIKAVVTPPAFDYGDPRREKLFGDLVVDVDPAGLTLGWGVQPQYNDFTEPDSEVFVGAGQIGRAEYVIDVNSGLGKIRKNQGIAFTGIGKVKARLILWEPAAVPKVERTFLRATDWDDAGYFGVKFMQGCILEVDTGGQVRTFQVQYDGGQVGATLQITDTIQGEVPFGFPVPFPAHLVRIVPLDGGSWLNYRVRWVFEPMPELVAYWQTQETTLDLPGYHQEERIIVAYISNRDATLTIKAGNSVQTYALPSSGNIYTKLPILEGPNKALWYSYAIATNDGNPGIRVFQKDLEVRHRPWTGGPYQPYRPFGDLSRESGARI